MQSRIPNCGLSEVLPAKSTARIHDKDETVAWLRILPDRTEIVALQIPAKTFEGGQRAAVGFNREMSMLTSSEL